MVTLLSSFPVAVTIADKSNIKKQEFTWQRQEDIYEFEASLFFLPISKC